MHSSFHVKLTYFFHFSCTTSPEVAHTHITLFTQPCVSSPEVIHIHIAVVLRELFFRLSYDMRYTRGLVEQEEPTLVWVLCITQSKRNK